MALSRSIRAYFRVRPRGLVDALRLFSAFARSVFLRVAMPSRFQSVGLVTRGIRNLHVVVDGIDFEVRPRTNDLDLISPKHEPLTTSWFQVRANDIVVDVGAQMLTSEPHVYAPMHAEGGCDIIGFEPLKERGVDFSGLERAEGSSFRWRGRYRHDLNSAETLETHLGVFSRFSPKIPEKLRSSPYLFLANIDPRLQIDVLR